MRKNENNAKPTMQEAWKKYVNGSIIRSAIFHVWLLGMLLLPKNGELCFKFVLGVFTGDSTLDGASDICCLIGVALAVLSFLAFILTVILFKEKYAISENIYKSPGRRFINALRACLGVGFLSAFLCNMVGMIGVDALSSSDAEYLELGQIMINMFLPTVYFLISVILFTVALGNKREKRFNANFNKAPSPQAQEPEKTDTPVLNADNADILIKYKQLYESGAITEEEYEKKKKELLGL